MKQFLLTLKTPIQVQQQRLDKSAIVLRTSTLLVEWPLVDGKPVENTLIDLRVLAFVVGDNFWESPFRESGCEPFEIQLRRDSILSRQENHEN